MEKIFAYAVPFLSLVYAAFVHRQLKTQFWLPCLISAPATGATALIFYALLGKTAASYLYVLTYAAVTGFILAILIGFLIKYASGWFR